MGEGEPKRMAKDKRKNPVGHQGQQAGGQNAPEWAAGLRRLYDSVVEEPLPDSFSQLLEQLDRNGKD
jgi:hypothetical protein